MFDNAALHPANAGLAELLSALQPRDIDAPAPTDIAELQKISWDQGYAAGSCAAEAELAPLRRDLVNAAEALSNACRIDRAGLRPVLAALIRQIAEAVLQAELAAGAAVLMPLVDAALAALRPGEVAALHGHPATLAALRDHLPDMVMIAAAHRDVGGFAVTGTDFMIDISLAARLAEIMGEIP